MQILKLYDQLMSMIHSKTPDRSEQKSRFIESRIKQLPQQELNDEQLSSQIQNFMQYSEHGVAASLLHQRNMPANLKEKLLEELGNSNNTNYVELPLGNHKIIAQSFSDGNPSLAMIYNSSYGITSAKVTSFADDNELIQLLKNSALDECSKMLKAEEINSHEFIRNIKDISQNPDEFIRNIFQQTDYNISSIADDLQNEVNLETELDKLLRKNFSDKKIEAAIIAQLDRNGSLEAYQLKRTDEFSVLTDEAKQKLMLLVEQHYQNTPKFSAQADEDKLVSQNQKTVPAKPENEIKPGDKNFKPNLKELSQEFETLFRKVTVGEGENQHYYFENTDSTIKIHPEKISVKKISRDSVELAIAAAIDNYGNNLDIRGTQEFKEVVLSILSNDKYKDIQLNNQELQEKLNELRGILPVENTIAPALNPDMKIQEPVQLPGLPTNITQPINPTELIIYDLVHNMKLDPVKNNEDVINYFLKHKFNATQANEIRNEINSGYILDKRTNPATKFDINIENPGYLVNIFTSRINLSRFTTQDYDQHFLCGPIDRINELDNLLQQRSNVRTENDLGIDYRDRVNLLVKEIEDSWITISQQEYNQNPHETSQQKEPPHAISNNLEKKELDLFYLLDHRAKREEPIELFTNVLNTCSNINQLNIDKDSALMYAIEYGLTNEAKALVTAGINVNLNNESTALSRAIYAAPSDHLELCKILIAAGANPNLSSADGSTPLMYAAGVCGDNLSDKERLELCKFLISSGADLNQKNEAGASAIGCAVSAGNVKIVESLIVAGADVNIIDNQQRNLLHRINAKDGEDAIHLAQLLLANGTNPNHLDAEGKTASILKTLQVAQHFETIEQDKQHKSLGNNK